MARFYSQSLERYKTYKKVFSATRSEKTHVELTFVWGKSGLFY